MPQQVDPAFQRNAVEAAVRIGALALLAVWCFDIVRPFAAIAVWAILLAVAMQPSYSALKARIAGSDRGAITLIVVVVAVVLIGPTLYLAGSIVEDAGGLGARLRSGELKLPPLPQSIANAPLIGHRAQEFWAAAEADPAGSLGPYVRKMAQRVLGAAANLSFTLLQFGLAFVAALALMANAEKAGDAGHAIARRFFGDRGDAIADLSTNIIRSVARGILGVALLEGLVAGIGLKLLGVPGAGLWALAVLALAIVQIPAPLLVFAIAAVLFAQGSTGAGAAAIVLGVVVAVIDNVLKPILLGRGVPVPMLVVLIGAIGGTLSMGIIGLFVGPIVLVLGYTVFTAWMYPEDVEGPTAPV